jgi:hypothetical protein
VASAGDVNGDGYADVIVSAMEVELSGNRVGAALVYDGGPSGVSTSIAGAVYGRPSGHPLGVRWIDAAVSSAGDVNADGFADVIVGVLSPGTAHEAWVLHGGPGGIGNVADVESVLELDSSFISYNLLPGGVAGAGDVNGDGYADVIAAGQSGSARVFFGSAAGVPDAALGAEDAELEVSVADDAAVRSVAGAGDVNGDGFADVIVGEHYPLVAGPVQGAAFVFHGNGNRTGRPVQARQEPADGVGTRVAPWGVSGAAGAFDVRLHLDHPEGAGRVRAEIEACPAGEPFGDPACTVELSPAWFGVGPSTPSMFLAHTLTGLDEGVLYHWRARVLRAPATGPVPANPAHGPWRRLSGQAIEADIRTMEDADGDGVSDPVEAGAPNGGDGNDDGQPDAGQAGVTSIPDAASLEYVTLEVSGGGCMSLTDVDVVSEAQMAEEDPSYDYPGGLVGFAIPCPGPVAVKLYYHGMASLSGGYRKFGPSTPGNPATAQWYEFPGAVFGSQMVGGTPVPTVTLSLVDGALGDATGVDGVIYDPGGPAVSLIPGLPAPALLLLGVVLAATARARRK